MKRFIVFSGIDYYPRGGFRDFNSSHDYFESARASVDLSEDPKSLGRWFQILDLETGNATEYNAVFSGDKVLIEESEVSH